MFDVNADSAADDKAGPGLGAQRCRSRRLRFPLDLSGVEAYTREIDDNTANTHHQHDLKRYPSPQT